MSTQGISENAAAAAEAVTPKTKEALAEYTPAMQRMDRFSVAAFVVVAGYAYWRLFSVTVARETLLIGAAALAGYVAADFFTGFAHWLFDTWGSIHTPVIGKAFIRPFREHHWDQKAITHHDFFETNGNNCLVSLPVLIAATLAPVADGPTWRFATAFILFMTLGVFMTNQFHKWSHLDAPPPVIAKLQEWHLILPRDHHQLHHQKPYDTHYNITTGWLNGPMATIKFYRGVEKVISGVTGAVPRQDDLA